MLVVGKTATGPAEGAVTRELSTFVMHDGKTEDYDNVVNRVADAVRDVATSALRQAGF